MASKTAPKATKTHVKLSERVVKASQVVTAFTVLIGAITGIYTWLDNRFINRVSEQIEDLRVEMEASDESTDRKLTRLELMNLIQNQPTNIAEVERVAKHYFVDCNGDWYATKFYSEWATAYGGDTSFITAGGK